MTNENNWTKVEPEQQNFPPVWNSKDEAGNFVLKQGDELVGNYQGKEEDVGPNKSILYNFKNPKGEFIQVWGSAILDARFKTLEVGDEVRVVYQGKVKSEKTGRSYHSYEVYHRKPTMEDIPVINE